MAMVLRRHTVHTLLMGKPPGLGAAESFLVELIPPVIGILSSGYGAVSSHGTHPANG